jgi:hypothetical protein
VILLENSNECYLSPAKRRILKKRERERKKKRREKERSKDWKANEVKRHTTKLYVSKGEAKKELKERKKGDNIFL